MLRDNTRYILEDAYPLIYGNLIYTNKINKCLPLTITTLLRLEILLPEKGFFSGHVDYYCKYLFINAAFWPTSLHSNQFCKHRKALHCSPPHCGEVFIIKEKLLPVCHCKHSLHWLVCDCHTQKIKCLLQAARSPGGQHWHHS